jgi:hypothetical protein
MGPFISEIQEWASPMLIICALIALIVAILRADWVGRR